MIVYVPLFNFALVDCPLMLKLTPDSTTKSESRIIDICDPAGIGFDVVKFS